jgi:hypothetical protein
LPEGAADIGEVVAGPPGQVTVVDGNGAATVLPRAGWDHFR